MVAEHLTDAQLAQALLDYDWPDNILGGGAFLIGRAAARLMKR